ncbi:MAG: hypothetical protein ACLP8S_04395 [Solirubrobacteraceae bacterium]
MTSHYATIKHQTLRREFDLYQDQIKISGEIVHLDPDGPLSDAAWAKENLARAKQTLPNGYCGLPLQQQCPHPNACLTCPSFLTTTEFLPLHREQLTAPSSSSPKPQTTAANGSWTSTPRSARTCCESSTGYRRSSARPAMTAEHRTSLAAAAARKHDSTLARAASALLEFDRAGAAVNFQTVARAAGFSRQWLYQQRDVRLQIEQLRVPHPQQHARDPDRAALQRGLAAPANPVAAGREPPTAQRDRRATCRARARLRPTTRQRHTS